MALSSTFSLVNKTSRSFTERDVPFQKIKESVLGKKYELSVAIVGAAESRRITKATKGKDKASNVLSFPLSKTSGEIVLCPAAAHEFTVGYLFIHGLCHLKGYKHSATMDSIERRYLRKWGLKAHE